MPPPMPRNEELEKRIVAQPDDPDAYLVYADWLQKLGDPRGELITVQHALSVMSEPERGGLPGDALVQREKAILEANDRFLPEVPEKMVHAVWRRGFVESIHFDDQGDGGMDDATDVAAIATRVFASPVALVTRELLIGVMRWDHVEEDVPAILKIAGTSPAGPHIRRIHIGRADDVDANMYFAGHLDAFATLFPALESLVIYGSHFTFCPWSLPRLRKLAVETCGLTKEHVQHLLASKLPALEHLELWFGSENNGADCGAADLAPLLDGDSFPAVTHLGLRNAEFTDDLPRVLAASKLLPRLRTLDLSKGTMSGAGARAMLDARPAFSHLASINVDECFLGEDDLEALRGIGPEIVTDEQKEDDVSIPGEVYRYVSMHE